ncbi:MAG: hypothetical protein PHQ58_07695 [Rhodoferax sp.]|uniref:hypothetical protein n=1 Tax=Rhodoferax sp. TaxID=50421 RepID=UPI0026127474|nr:hypothetical protein [Rhodoferax sp.]MDD2880306.1 hypothetical protein [Rhodoferax sp.]
MAELFKEASQAQQVAAKYLTDLARSMRYNAALIWEVLSQEGGHVPCIDWKMLKQKLRFAAADGRQLDVVFIELHTRHRQVTAGRKRQVYRVKNHIMMSVRPSKQQRPLQTLSVVVPILAVVMVMGFLRWQWFVAVGGSIDFS